MITARNRQGKFDLQGIDEWPQPALIVERCVGEKEARQFQPAVTNCAATHLAGPLFGHFQPFVVLICIHYQIHQNLHLIVQHQYLLRNKLSKYFVNLYCNWNENNLGF